MMIDAKIFKNPKHNLSIKQLLKPKGPKMIQTSTGHQSYAL